jgi:gas vesicle protein
MNSTSKIIASVLAGVAAGAVLGLLFAPEKGEETRRRISEKYNDLSDSVKEKLNDLVNVVKDEYEYAKDSATDLVNKASGQTPSMKSEPNDQFRNA